MNTYIAIVLATIALCSAFDHVGYLKQFNYLSSNLESLNDLDTAVAMDKAISNFQEMFNLEITGIMNEATEAAMMLPRCGVVDMHDDRLSITTNVDNFVLNRYKWHHNVITYRIVKYTKDLPKVFVDKTAIKALNYWGDVTKLSFRRLYRGQADIEISFVVKDHGDSSPFDGPGHTLAHAYFPNDDNKPIRGDAHFDDDELWLKKGRGNVRHSYNLLQVMTHEFGHSLGLRHSKNINSVMAPRYKKFDPHFKLYADDIKGIQALYGKKSGATTESTTKRTTERTTERTTQGTGSFNKCRDGKLDAVTTGTDGKPYGFRGSHFFEFQRSIHAPVKTQSISDGWRGLPNNIDAALLWKAASGRKARVYFFKGSNYYRFEGRNLVKGYPRKISCGFPGIPNNLDAAFVNRRDNKTYFVKNNRYYEYSRSRGHSKSPVPKSRSPFKHLKTNNLTGAFYSKFFKNTYFFSGKKYYRLNRDMTANRRYPRNISKYFLGCKK